MSLRTEVRKKSYKTGVDADEARRRREDNLFEIRKKKREDNLHKKRRERLVQSQISAEPSQGLLGAEKRLESLPVIYKEYGMITLHRNWSQPLNSGNFYQLVAWALGNLAGDSSSCRDLILGQGALMPLLSQLNEHSKLSMLRNAT